MHYQPRDRAPIMDFSFWEETLVIWQEQGLPKGTTVKNSDSVFGMDGLERYVASYSTLSMFTENIRQDTLVRGGINVGLCPRFETAVLEDRGEHEVIQQADGVRVLRKKFMSSIPSHEGHLLVDRESWKKHYKPRLDPENANRISPNWEDCVERWSSPGRDYPLFLPGGSLFGWLRNWMGLEAITYVVYDDPAWFEEMVETITDCIVNVLEKALASGISFQACGMWEDMCYNAGPLLSPENFKRFLVPHYKRITNLLKRHGVDIVWTDCDGDIRHLAPLWLEAGVNCMFPIEVGTWKGDPLWFRREFGRDMLLMGGFDKHILAKDRKSIEEEIHRLTPLVDEGGYIPFCDHRVPPDVPLANYLYYLDRAREVWGRNFNLKPMDAILASILN